MAGVQELIRLEEDGTLSFGNHELTTKQKALDFEDGGNLYQVKTYRQITRLEKNNRLLLETVPGATVRHFYLDETTVAFTLEAAEDVQVTLELYAGATYDIFAGGRALGAVKANLAGKISFSLAATGEEAVPVRIRKADS